MRSRVAEAFESVVLAHGLGCDGIGRGCRKNISTHTVILWFIHCLDMHEILTAKIFVAKRAEDVIQNAGRVLDRFVALHLSGGFEPREREGIDKFL